MNGMNNPDMKGKNKLLFNPFGFLIECCFLVSNGVSI